MATAEGVEVEVGDKTYKISITRMPYLAAYADFPCRSGQATMKLDSIPQFEAAYQGVENGFRYCFRQLGTQLTDYHALCNTLDLL